MRLSIIASALGTLATLTTLATATPAAGQGASQGASQGTAQGAAGQGGAASPAADAPPPGNPVKKATSDGTAPPAVEAAKRAPPPVKLSVVYTDEIWGNTRGGMRTGVRYLDNLDVTLTIDAERALGWRGVTLFAYGLYDNGAAFSRDVVGDAQTISNIETGVRAARLYQAWIDKRFGGEGARASIRFGLYDLNSEFDTTDVGSLSLLSSHGIGPEFGQSGLNGPSIFPSTSLAVRVDYKIDAHVVVRAAVLDGVPGDPAHPGRTAIKLSGRDGALLVGEVDYIDDETKAGVGVWRYTSPFAGLDATGSPSLAKNGGAERRADNGGLYLLVERRLIHSGGLRAADGVKPGLAGFVQLGFANGRINPIEHYLGGGLVYTGLLRREHDDRVGVTVARASFGAPYRRAIAATGATGALGDRAETVIEMTYRTPLTAWLTVQPDVQYVIDPGGDPALRDALAVGVRGEIGF